MSQSISLLDLTVSALHMVKELYGDLLEDHINNGDTDSANVVTESINRIEAELNHIRVNDCYYDSEIVNECLILANDLLLSQFFCGCSLKTA